MQFKVTLKNNEIHYINATNIKEAQKVTRKKFGDWQNINLLLFKKDRKSNVLNKRQYVKESDKRYNRKKVKRELKKKIQEEDY